MTGSPGVIKKKKNLKYLIFAFECLNGVYK